jgi:predicted DNA-binding transcriptional regulator AlpA
VTHHLLGTAEVAELLSVSRQRVDQLASSYADFPKPEAELAAGRIWARAAVDAWLATHPERRAGRAEGRGIMFDHLSDLSRQSFVLAQEEARELGHNYVGCEHLVVATLRADGVAARALATMGLTLGGARAALRRVLPPGPHGSVQWEQLPFTPRVSRALEHAQETAIELGHSRIGTEHLLLGILREGENVGCRLFLEAGLDLSAVRLRVLQEMGHPQPSQDPDRERRLTTTLEKVLDRLADIDARLERIELERY